MTTMTQAPQPRSNSNSPGFACPAGHSFSVFFVHPPPPKNSGQKTIPEAFHPKISERIVLFSPISWPQIGWLRADFKGLLAKK
jgi:hypothetical protein